MYDFKDFISNVKEGLEQRYPDVDISLKDVVKNNDVIQKALVMNSPQKNAAPTIYMDYYYSRYRTGVALENIIERISEKYNEAINNPYIDEDKINDLSNYFIKVVNRDKNKKYLENSPYIEFEDLALTIRCLISKDNKDIASAQVNNSFLQMHGLSREELFKIAKENTPRLFPPVIRKLSELINGYPFNEAEEFDNEFEMYVITNDCGVNGATVMIYDDVIQDFVKEHGECYIIPSSIHELIALPKKYHKEDAEMLRLFIKEVNKTAVHETEVLSDNLYVADENGILLVNDMEKEDYMDM